MSIDCENTLIKFFEHNSRAMFLDCGCFNGERTIKMARVINTKNIFGIDFNRDKILMARKLKIKAIRSDLNDVLPYKDNFFDVVTSIHSIEHLIYPDNFVKEVYRVLKPNGYFIVLTPNLASWHNVIALLFGIQPFSGPNIFDETDLANDGNIIDQINLDELKRRTINKQDQEDGRHIKVMTYKTLKKLLKLKHFKIEKSSGFGYYPFPNFFSRLLCRMDISHSHYFIMKARK